MVDMTEKFEIRITGDGLIIHDISMDQSPAIEFSASEALMLLDILKQEESNLRRIADAASPIPIRFRFAPSREIDD